MATRLNYNIPLRQATLMEWNVADNTQPHEMTTLKNYIPERGALVARPQMQLLSTANISAESVNGCYGWTGGTNANWLLMACAEPSTHYTRMVAIKVDFTKTDSYSDPCILETISSNETSMFIGQRFSFHEYRGKVFASNGFEIFSFDGTKWVGPNQVSNGTDGSKRCGTDIAFTAAVGFLGRSVHLGNKVYPNELSWCRVWEDWDGNTPSTGFQNLGGFEEPPTTDLRTLAFYKSAGYLGGNMGAFYRSYNRGRTWDLSNASTVDDIQLLSVYDQSIWVLTETTSGGHALSYSSDGGTNYNNKPNLMPMSIHGKKMQFVDATTGYFVTGREMGVGDTSWDAWKTTNAGDSWTRMPLLTGVNTSLDEVDISMTENASSGVAIMGSDKNYSHIARYDGSSWTILTTTALANILTAVSTLDDNRYIVVGRDGYIRESYYNGSAWENTVKTVSTTTPDFYCVCYYAVNHAVALGEGGDAYYRTASSGDWARAKTRPPADVFDVRYDDAGRLYCVGAGGTVYYSDNYGVDWTELKSERDKFTDSDLLEENEELRAGCHWGGHIAVATDRNLYLYNTQMAQTYKQANVEVLNSKCLVEWNGLLWFAGRVASIPGVYAWDGNGTPRLMSRGAQTTIDAITWQPSPKNQIVKLDTDEELTPPLSKVLDRYGLYYSTTQYKLKKGVLRLNRGTSDAIIYSHANTAGSPIDTDGYYFPDMTTDNSFGTFAIEGAFNDESSTGNEYSHCQPQIRVAYAGSAGVPGTATWTSWTDIAPSITLPPSGQDANFARYVMLLDRTMLGCASNKTYKWLQFKITGTNNPPVTQKSNWSINRICIIPQVNTQNETSTSVASPSLVVWDDKLWFHFANTSLVFSDGGSKMSVVKFGYSVNDSTTLAGKMVLAGKSMIASSPQILFNKSSIDDVNCDCEIQTGRIDFSGVNPKYADIRKKFRRITVRAKPSENKSTGGVTLKWWPDGRSGDCGTKSLTFDSTHNPDAQSPTVATRQVRTVELHSTPDSANNQGWDLTVEATSGGSLGNPVDLIQISVEADTVTDEIRTSDGEA